MKRRLSLSLTSFVIALGLASCSSAKEASTENASMSPDGGARADASSGSAATCMTDADCVGSVPPTTPPGCAIGKCDTLSGTCSFLAKDGDGDGHPSASCQSTNGVPVQTGDDCNDNDPNIFPGHSESCTANPDGGVLEGTLCQSGERSCLQDGTESGCVGAVACVNQTCRAGACAGICAQGQTQCAPDGTGVETCDASGMWGDALPCVKSTCAPTGDAGSMAACTGSCSAGSTQCAGTMAMQTCTAGVWGAPASCASSETCATTTGACGGTCGPNDTRCDPQNQEQPQTCGATGEWQNSGSSCKSLGMQCVSGSCKGHCSSGDTQSCGMALGTKGNCASGTTTCDGNGNWGPCSVAPAAHDGCSSGDDATCNGTPNEGCQCVGAQTTGCGNCGTAQCLDGPSPSGFGSCNNQGVCAPGATFSCNWSYPYGCPATNASCGSDCGWGACVPPAPSPFAPAGLSGVAGNIGQVFKSGPNCFGSSNSYTVSPVCPSGSAVQSASCTMVNQGGGVTGGHCTTSVSGTSVGITVTANSNCTVNAQATLNVQCIASSCGTSAQP